MEESQIKEKLKLAGARIFLFFVFCIGVPLLLIWCTLVIKFTFPKFISPILSICFPIASVILLLSLKDLTKSLKIFAASCAGIMLFYLSISPSLNRDWVEDVKVLPEIEIDGKNVKIKNYRNFTYSSNHEFQKNYEEKTYNLDELEGTDFIISYWDGYRSIGHTFVSFRFKNRPPLCISVEVRKEKGEKYKPLDGLFKQYELIYVIGDERDLISLRTNHRAEETFLYPLNLDQAQSKAFLLSLLEGAKELQNSPKFYHSLDQNCTTTLVKHINSVPNFKIKVNMDLVLNGLSDYAVYKMEGVRTDLEFAVLKRCCYISKLAKSLQLDENYSNKLRQSVDQKIEYELNQAH